MNPELARAFPVGMSVLEDRNVADEVTEDVRGGGRRRTGREGSVLRGSEGIVSETSAARGRRGFVGEHGEGGILGMVEMSANGVSRVKFGRGSRGSAGPVVGR